MSKYDRGWLFVSCVIYSITLATCNLRDDTQSLFKYAKEPLVVGRALRAQRIVIGDEIVRYGTEGMLPDRSYEVRVSFPATNPVLVNMWLEPRGGGAGGGSGGRLKRSRKLLNAEKIDFVTNALGLSLWRGNELGDVDVLFQATKWGVSGDGKGQKYLLYDIILEENYLGIPLSGMPLVATAMVLTLMCALLLPKWVNVAVPGMQRWLAAGEAWKDRSK